MKKFLAVFIGTHEARERSGWNSMSEDQRTERQRAGIDAWKQWVQTNKDSIVDGGSPLGKTKRTSLAGVEDARNNITAYTVVEALSHEAAARLFEQHPHFTIFPGDSVEIMECLPIPGV